MCRFFAYIGHEECLLEDMLITPAHGLTHQVHDHYLPGLLSQDSSKGSQTTKKEIDLRNRLFNDDGFGMAWYSEVREEYEKSCHGPRAAFFKTIQPPLNEHNMRSISANTSTKVLFSHIRAASLGSYVTPQNNHPFLFGRHTFMHNGEVAMFKQIERQLCMLIDLKLYTLIKGGTDSEHVAALYLTNLSKQTSDDVTTTIFSLDVMKQALESTIHTIIDLQKSMLSQEDLKVAGNDLNMCTTDGKKLLAVRYRNHQSEYPPSLYYSTKAGPTLNRKYPGHPDTADKNQHAPKNTSDHAKHVIVSSEPITYKESDWELIPKNNFVLVEEDMSMKMEEFK